MQLRNQRVIAYQKMYNFIQQKMVKKKALKQFFEYARRKLHAYILHSTNKSLMVYQMNRLKTFYDVYPCSLSMTEY